MKERQLQNSNEEELEPLVLSAEKIQKKVVELIKKPISSVADLERFFSSWWCRHYNKPYKCKELQEYSLEELIYEYFDVSYRNDPSLMEVPAADEGKEEDEEWLKEMMGEQYSSREEQEKQLESKRDVLEAIGEKSEEFKHTF